LTSTPALASSSIRVVSPSSSSSSLPRSWTVTVPSPPSTSTTASAAGIPRSAPASRVSAISSHGTSASRASCTRREHLVDEVVLGVQQLRALALGFGLLFEALDRPLLLFDDPLLFADFLLEVGPRRSRLRGLARVGLLAFEPVEVLVDGGALKESKPTLGSPSCSERGKA